MAPHQDNQIQVPLEAREPPENATIRWDSALLHFFRKVRLAETCIPCSLANRALFRQAGLKETLNGFERDMMVLSKETELEILPELLRSLAQMLQVCSRLYLFPAYAAHLVLFPSV